MYFTHKPIMLSNERPTLLMAVQINDLFQRDSHGVVPVNTEEQTPNHEECITVSSNIRKTPVKNNENVRIIHTGEWLKSCQLQ